MAGFHKGWSGSPFHTGYNTDEGMDIGDAQRGDDGPRVGPGKFSKRVTSEISRNSKGKAADKDD